MRNPALGFSFSEKATCGNAYDCITQMQNQLNRFAEHYGWATFALTGAADATTLAVLKKLIDTLLAKDRYTFSDQILESVWYGPTKTRVEAEAQFLFPKLLTLANAARLPTWDGSVHPARAPGSASASPTPNTAVGVLAMSYKCTTAVCYAVNSKPQHEVFVELQKTLNTVGGSAGFTKLNPDGIIGPSTLGAWNKTATWLQAQGQKHITTFLSIATMSAAAAVAAASLKQTLAAPALVAVSKPAPMPQAGLPPAAIPEIPVDDRAAHAAATKKTNPVYYAAAAIGGGVILYLAYQWAMKPTGPRVTAPAVAPALTGRRGR